MRTFHFKVKTIGDEKYLTYTMGEECELDEDVLDYCEENKPVELVDIIYEEDDDYDYLTYDISGRITLDDFIKNEVSCDKVLYLLRNIANSLISLKEQTIHLNYVLMNRSFMYVQEDCTVKCICVPVETEGAIAVEFKSFIRELLANMKYDVEEDLGYVGKLITYINGENFNLRGLIGLSEALMEEYGIGFESANEIASDGVEVVNSEPEVTEPKESGVADFMNSGDASDEPLPEIGDDEDEEDEEAIEQVPVTEEIKKDEADAPVEEKPEAPQPTEEKADDAKKEEKTPGVKETDENVIKNRLKALVGEPVGGAEPAKINSLDDLDNLLVKAPVVKRNVVKVNRAALIQSAAEHEEDGETTEPMSVVNSAEKKAANADIEDISADMNVEKDNKPKSNSILSKTVDAVPKATSIITMQKAVPYLIRINTEERIMLNKATFKLGKASMGVDYTVGGNKAISRLHAIILQKDGVCYIKDNKSTNHTYVNDKMLEDDAEEILTHDSTIRLGDEEFKFKIR